MTYNEYYNALNEIVDELLERLATEEFPLDEIYDKLHEEIDGHEYIIYTARNLEVLMHSSNWTALDDVGVDGHQDFATMVRTAAYFAMEADAREMLDREIENRGLE